MVAVEGGRVAEWEMAWLWRRAEGAGRGLRWRSAKAASMAACKSDDTLLDSSASYAVEDAACEGGTADEASDADCISTLLDS